MYSHNKQQDTLSQGPKVCICWIFLLYLLPALLLALLLLPALLLALLLLPVLPLTSSMPCCWCSQPRTCMMPSSISCPYLSPYCPTTSTWPLPMATLLGCPLSSTSAWPSLFVHLLPVHLCMKSLQPWALAPDDSSLPLWQSSRRVILMISCWPFSHSALVINDFARCSPCHYSDDIISSFWCAWHINGWLSPWTSH